MKRNLRCLFLAGLAMLLLLAAVLWRYRLRAAAP